MQRALLVHSQLTPSTVNNPDMTSHRLLLQRYVELLTVLPGGINIGVSVHISPLCNSSTKLTVKVISPIINIGLLFFYSENIDIVM
jgi:hypothetical protein